DRDLSGRGMPAFLASVAAKVPTSVRLQLHNEQNDPGRTWTPRLRGGSQGEWGEDYARLYARTREALDARGLKHSLVVGGLVGDPRPFLRGMRRAGITPPIVACHCYGRPVRVQVAERADQVRDVFPGARVWYTEVGSEVGMRDDAGQARDLAEAVEAAHAARVERLYWYRLNGPERGFELIRANGRPRPAWRRWQELSGR
ncbi:MAG TPA: hypothetical protein VEA99_10865, partial [Gemmatimonadaceae bacterium]|nr:hypothetical protein [Gemmatimonadaceae bacterium]